ncbi:MAG: hypothetical protein HOL99_12885 [Halieaceae bacterium]|nr:hypothetical protein [Halieaceae bacterium]
MEFGVWSLEFGVWSLEFGVWGLDRIPFYDWPNSLNQIDGSLRDAYFSLAKM